MAEYIERIIAFASGSQADNLFSTCPELVRCCDCEHATKLVDDGGLPIEGLEDWFSCHGKLATSWDYYNDEPKSNPVEPDGFCAWGERK